MSDIKVVFLGDTGVGKTCIIKQFTEHNFNQNITTSLSAQFISKTIDFEVFNKSIKFEIWDTAGHERFRSLAKIFYKDAKVVIFVYDVTDAKSFESIKNYWYEAVKNNKYNTNQILAVVANKIDLFAKQIVNNKDGKEFADKIGAIFQTISCHEDSGVNALFDIIGKIYIDPYYFDIKKEEIKKQYLNKKLQEQTQKKTKI